VRNALFTNKKEKVKDKSKKRNNEENKKE